MLPFFNKYPGTDLHEIDLAYILKTCSEMLDRVKAQDDKIAAVEQLAQELKDFVNNYFDNLDVQEEINNKIDQMARNGNLLALIEPTVEKTAAADLAAWIEENLTPGTGVVIDASLTVAGAAADAKATGDNVFTDHRIINDNMMPFMSKQNLYEGASHFSGTWFKTNDTDITIVDNENFRGYKVAKIAQPWRRIYKQIYVRAGKKYTFSAWIKPTVNTAVIIYAMSPNQVQTPAAVITPANFSYSEIMKVGEWNKAEITFECTQSGYINPHIIDAYSTNYYISHYVLEETENTIEPEYILPGIGDYKKYDFYASATGGQYWNPEIIRKVPSGTHLRLVFNYYTGTLLNYVRIDGRKEDGTYTNRIMILKSPVMGASADAVTSEDYVGLRVQFARTETESDVSGSIFLLSDMYPGAAYDILKSTSPHIYYVKKDGTGDFTELVPAINEATKYMDSIVYIDDGTYDIISELGDSYMNNVSSNNTTWGLVLKNRVHVIGSGKTTIQAFYNGSNTNVQEYFSVFNTGEHGFTLENVYITDRHCRYTIHDDRGNYSDGDSFTNKYINCIFRHSLGGYECAIGGGLAISGIYEFHNCRFIVDDGFTRAAYYHGNNKSGAQAQCKIYVDGCYFDSQGTFVLTNYGDSTLVSAAYVHSNSMGTEPYVNNGSYAPNQNMRMIKWNNTIH